MSAYNKEHSVIRNSAIAKRWMFSSALTAVSLATMALPTQAADYSKPTDGAVTHGSATTVQTGNIFDTYQAGDTVTTYKTSLNLEAHEGWNILSQKDGALSAHVVNTFDVNGRIYESIGSRIDGFVQGNVNLLLVDPNGVFFGANSRVDVQGLIATSGHIDDDQLINNDFGDYVIDNANGGSIELNGVINIAEAGLAAFVSPYVTNNGVINAKMGNVVLASGETVTLDLYGDGLFEVAVDGELSDALIKNKGTINAQGGTVKITALAAKGAVDNIINMDGVINVTSATQEGGKIILSGGDQGKVEVSGVLAASGATDGGSVKVTGQNVDVTKDAVVVADAGENGNGGDTYFYGNDYTIFSGTLSARGGSVSGNGGNAEISAGESVGYNGLVDLSAANGETGTLLIDPEHIVISDTWGYTPGTLTILDQAIANTLSLSNVNLWATETLSTGSDIDVSEYDYSILWFNFNGITSNTLTLAAPEVNLLHDITLGTGELNVADILTTDSILGFGLITPPHDIIVDHLNLDGKIYKRETVGGATSLADDAQINTTAGTINVLSNDASIQQAIQFADASAAEVETVNVAADTYTENLLVDRAVKLSGASGATIQAASAGNLITVTADNVNIDPFTFDGMGIAANGIYADGADNLIVDGNIFTGFTDSNININNSATVRIFDNTMTGANTGIYADNAYDIKINDNTVTDAGVTGLHVINTDGTNDVNDVDIWGNTITSSNTTTTGVLVENSDYATVGVTKNNPFASGLAGGNKISGGGDGIVIVNSDHSVARYNTVSNVGEDGIDIIGSQDVVVTLNTVNGTANGNHNDGISVSGGSSNVEVSKNSVINSGWDGIYTDSSTGTKIIENDVSGSNQVGITVLNNSVGTLVQDNTVSDSQRGILVKNGASDTTIIGNVVYDQTLDGIHAEGDSSLEVVGNYVGYADKVGTVGASNNITGDGVYLKDADGAQVNGNYVTQTGGNGIIVTNSDDVTVSYNEVDGAAKAGIFADNTSHIGIDGNLVKDGRGDGISVIGGNSAEIYRNVVKNQGDEGIDVNYNNNAVVSGNTIRNSGDEGIEVSYSANAKITDNIIKSSGGNGIVALGDSDAVITGNKIRYSGVDGIGVKNSTGALISGNKIRNSGSDGIYVYSGDNVEITGNRIKTSGDDGIDVSYNANAKITNNVIKSSGGNGIVAISDSDAVITGNKIRYSGVDGIGVKDSNGALISGNKIRNSNGDGIFVTGSNYSLIAGNHINTSGDDGINVKNSNNATIMWNGVTGSGNNGIEVYGGSNEFIWANFTAWNGGNGIEVTNNWGNVLIYSNFAMGNHDNGIYVNDVPHVEIVGNYASGNWSNGIYAKNISAQTTLIVNGNVTHNNGEDGIKASNLNTAYFTNNRSYDNGDDGIDVDTAYHVEISNNTVYGNGFGNMQQVRSSMPQAEIAYEENEGHGIEVSNIHGDRTLIIDDNNIHNNAVDGVNIENAERIIITDNEIYSNSDDGVDINWANHAEIVDNNIYNNGFGGFMPSSMFQAEIAYEENEGHGIEVSNIYGAYTLILDDNSIHNNAGDGVNVEDADRIIITNNDIFGNGDDGVDINRADHVEIVDNNIYENDNGIEASNIYGIGTLIIEDNNIHSNYANGVEVTDADVTYILNNDIYDNGAHGLAMLGWNNGSVVVEGNDFTNNPIGALFESGYIDISNLLNPNTFTNTDPSATPVGMVFDETGERGALSLVGNTLGAIEFSGFQNAGSFYVRLEDGTFLDSLGSPIQIDGLNASFDGITPSNTDGILTASDLGYIENRLYDADDSLVNGRGQIFVGEALGLNIEDFFNQFPGATGRFGGFNITIAGLPSVGPIAAGAPNAAGLNLISPAAGDDDEQNPEDLANIEPKAGNEKASCWGDAISAASAGATVTYSFGGSFEEALADASACSVTGL
jgi:parallel beta-helix repeat protein